MRKNAKFRMSLNKVFIGQKKPPIEFTKGGIKFIGVLNSHPY